MDAKKCIWLVLVLGSAVLWSGCPSELLPPAIGTWDYTESALSGYIRWDIKLNGTIEQTDLGHNILAGTLTWEMTSPTEIVIHQDNGPDQWIMTGTLLTDDYLSGTWQQIAGADTGTHGTWTANRFP